MRKIHLYGSLQKYSKEPLELSVNGLPQLIGLLEVQYPGIRQDIQDHKDWYVIKRKSNGEAVSIDESTALMPFGDADEIHIAPHVEGSGVELVVAAGWAAAGTFKAFVLGTLVNIGLSLALSAIMGSFISSPKPGKALSGRTDPSFIFDRAVNVEEEGWPVPLVYGQFKTGSVVISAGVATEDLL